METKVFIVRTWDDLVFMSRNREYGAYSLRQEYTKRLLLAMGLSTSIILVLLFLPRFFPASKITPSALVLPEKGSIELTLFPPPVKIKPVEHIRQSEVKTNNNDKTIQVVREAVTAPIENEAAVSQQVVQGHGEGGFVEGTPTGSAHVTSVLPAIGTGPVIAAEVMPSYEGGIEAMMKFIRKKLRYPLSAKRAEVEGTVFVSFVVNGDGSVQDVTVLRGIHPDCDKEAARVVSMLPGWSGGKQNESPVAVRMVLPIKFSLNK